MGASRDERIPTIDLYFSALAFEPPNAAANNYSEKLVMLPDLSVYVEPLALPNADPDLRSLQLPTNQPLLLCPGQPFKYAPQYDDVWVRIAKGLQMRTLFREEQRRGAWCSSEATTAPGTGYSKSGCAPLLLEAASISTRT